MTVNLESFRYPFETEIANESDGAKAAHRNAYQGILDLNQAVASLKSQLTSATTTTSSSSSSTSTSSSSSTGTQTVVTNTATTTIGYVNDQTGVTAYTTLQSDYAKFIILDDASPIAVTLSVASSAPAITTPWYAIFLNFGAGTTTLTPISGTISYQGNLAAASMPVAQGSAATVVYDGSNFWAELIPLIGGVVTQIIAGNNVTISPTSGVGAVTVNATGTITGVTAGTGLTGGGTSGTVTLALSTPVTVANGGTGTASPSLVAGSNVTITGSWPDQTINATGTITGVTAGTGMTGGGTSGTVTLSLATPVSIANGGTGTASPGLVAGSNITITGTWPNQTINATGGSTYSLGGTLSSSNIVVGAGAGTGATVSVTGLDGNHNVNLVTGTSPTANDTLFTLTYTTSRGHDSLPVLYASGGAGYTSFAQMVIVTTTSSAEYVVISGATALAASTNYSWNVSCP